MKAIKTAILFAITAIFFSISAQAASLGSAEGLAAATGVPCDKQQASQTAIMQDRKAKRIPIIGRTADCKYPRYDLEGDLSDFNYFSGNLAYSETDVIRMLPPIKPEDNNSKAGYVCMTVCKDARGFIVGINPSYAKQAKKK